MLENLVKSFLSIPQVFVIGAVFLLTALESAVFLGLVIPGELVVIVGGIVASRSDVSLTGVIIAGVLGPIVGDSIGYFVGRRYWRRFLRRRRNRRWGKAKGFLRRKGAVAVFLARFTAFLRSVMPAAAGAARIPYGRFLVWDVAAALLWGGGSAMLGYFAGHNYKKVALWAGHFSVALLALFAVGAGVLLWRGRLRRRARVRSRPHPARKPDRPAKRARSDGG